MRTSEVRGRRSEPRCERLGFRDHLAQLAANGLDPSLEIDILLVAQISAGSRGREPVGSFLCLAVGVRELADEMGRITPLRPAFGDIRPDGTRRTPNLVGERVLLLAATVSMPEICPAVTRTPPDRHANLEMTESVPPYASPFSSIVHGRPPANSFRQLCDFRPRASDF